MGKGQVPGQGAGRSMPGPIGNRAYFDLRVVVLTIR
jgi:hypothetical protein